MSDSIVRAFKEGQENVHDKPRSGRPLVISDDLVNAVNKKKFVKIDNSLFRYLKEFLGGKLFGTDDEVKEAVKDWLSSQAADFYNLGIPNFFEQCYERFK
uniref:Uncharacterized protein n=1 Tax=Cuerna arida TaxID=1464854 RepID=A0A1B6G874_9HEMI